LGYQALSGSIADANQMAGLSSAAKSRSALVDYQNELTAYENKRRDLQLGFGIAGGIAGAAAGGYAGGPTGAVTGAGSGFGLGVGIGGMAAGSAPTQKNPYNGMGGGV
jgi:hypothetical protein